jgi:Calcineurin-like phosphoesterase
METEEIKNVPERTNKEYLNNKRSELTNHLRTELSKGKVPRVRRNRRKKIADFLSKEIWSWLYHYFKSRFGIKAKYRPYPIGETGIYKLTKSAASANEYMSVAITSDWATDTKESVDICRQIKRHEPDYTIHIGDIYFVGAPHEVKKNFVSRRSPWVRGNTGSFALLGNHEMYARGEAFFEHLLPTLGIKTINGNYDGQKAGFFCLENDHWRILGLDTGYHSIGIPIIEFLPFCSPDSRLDKILVNWLKDTVRLGDPNDKRGLVILSHHQFITAFNAESEYSVPANQIASIIGQDRKIIWLWGHEHKLSLFEKAEIRDNIFVYGRCIGHGGTPIEIESRGFTKSSKKKGFSKLVMFDNRKEQEVEGTALGYNGYAVLKLKDNELKIEYYDRHIRLFSEKWTSDISAGNIKGSIEVPPGSPLKPEQGKAWEDACRD